jgi:hypothetical protein
MTMATSKTATKAAPAKKAPAKPRTDYKEGTRVKATDRFGGEHKGFVTSVETKKTGSFIYVNIGDKKNPSVVGYRPAKVRGF